MPTRLYHRDPTFFSVVAPLSIPGDHRKTGLFANQACFSINLAGFFKKEEQLTLQAPPNLLCWNFPSRISHRTLKSLRRPGNQAKDSPGWVLLQEKRFFLASRKYINGHEE